MVGLGSWRSPWWRSLLVRHGRKTAGQVIRPAVVAPKYEAPTPAVITRALGALGIAGINEALRDGAGSRS